MAFGERLRVTYRKELRDAVKASDGMLCPVTIQIGGYTYQGLVGHKNPTMSLQISLRILRDHLKKIDPTDPALSLFKD